MLTISKIFLICCLVFVVGIAGASFAPVKIFEYKIYFFAGALTFLLLSLALKKIKPRVSLGLIFLSIFLLSLWRYGMSLPENTPDKIWHYNGQTVVARGVVANEPDVREANQKLEIKAWAIQEQPEAIGEGTQNIASPRVNGKLLVTTNLYPEYQYGDEVEMMCNLEKPAEFNGFAYDRYLARYDIYSVCYWPKSITRLSPASQEVIIRSPFRQLADPFVKGGKKNNPPYPLYQGGRKNIFYGKIFAFKKYLAGLIETGMTEPESSLARPIVFGGQKGLPENIRADFSKVGLTHIMAVSGFNISIVAAIAMFLLLGLGASRSYSFYLASAFLALYIILVGASASATRAGLMGFLVLWALKLGRLNKMTNSLVLAAAILLMFNPKLLRDDVGFQLSFLAMAGLSYAYPILEALWQKIKLPKLKGLSQVLLLTLAAQVFTLPILAYNFSQVSIIAPLANLAVLWAVPILTILILAALPLAALLPGLAFIFFLPSLILTKYILLVVKHFAKLPYASLEVNYFSFVWAVLYYALLIFIIIKLRESKLLSEQINDKL